MMTMIVEHTSGAELKQNITYPDLTGEVVKWKFYLYLINLPLDHTWLLMN